MLPKIDEVRTERPDKTMAVLVVDTERFSEHDDDTQSDMQVFVVDVLQRSFERAKLGRFWREGYFLDGTGDGYIVCFHEDGLWFAVQGLFDALQEELRLAARQGDADLRMRLALNLGPVPAELDERLNSPVGKTMIDTCRMVDGDQTRALLKNSDRELTRLAVVVTDSVLGWTLHRKQKGWHRASEYVAHEITVKGKPFEISGHLHVPAPSGDLLVSGLAGVQASSQDHEEHDGAVETTAAAGVEVVDVVGDRNKSYVDVSGGVLDESVGTGAIDGSVGVIGHFGNNGDVAGRDVVRDSTVNNAGRDINRPFGDVNNGRHSGRRLQPWDDGTGSPE